MARKGLYVVTPRYPLKYSVEGGRGSTSKCLRALGTCPFFPLPSYFGSNGSFLDLAAMPLNGPNNEE